VARIAQDHGIGKITVGDVRGIEQRTNQAEARRCKTSRNQRRRLSQWSRGIQEDYLGYKTALELEYIQEDYSSQTCLACLTRRLPATVADGEQASRPIGAGDRCWSSELIIFLVVA
jgi:putative transposase